MDDDGLEKLADGLARNRAAGLVSDLPLAALRDAGQAYAVQAEAISAFATDVVGYTLVGTSPAARRTLGLDAPIVGPIAQGSLIRDDKARFRIPEGFIGAQCEFVFTLGAPLEIPNTTAPGGEAAVRSIIERSVMGCRPGIGLLGRRAHPMPASSLAAIADYALHVATLCGPHAEGFRGFDLDQVVVRARIDGNEVARAPAGAVMDHPLNALAWLAARLGREGAVLSTGDVVATGSCTPILQVLPGQRLEVDFGPVGSISCDFA